MVNVKSKRCNFEGCRTVVLYGTPGHQAIRCAQHAEVGMISRPLKRCMEPRCREPATFGINRAVHCVLHTKYPEVSLVGGVCTSCGLVDILDSTSLCSSCDPNAFKRARLAKQREVKLWLDSAGHGNYVSYDRIIDGGTCGLERPDFLYDCGTHYVSFEVDENQATRPPSRGV